MRQPNRTPKRWPILPILHPSRLFTPSDRSIMNPEQSRHPTPTGNPILSSTPAKHLIQHTTMISMHNGIHSKNTAIRPSPMTPESPRRSPYCGIHSPCRRTPKTGRIWNNTNYHTTKPTNKPHSLSLHDTIPMRDNHDKLYLLAPNRLKIPNCLLLSKPHGPSNHSSTHSITMKLHRSNSPNNRPRSNIIPIILLSQFQL